MSTYNVGVGKESITYVKPGGNMFGFSNSSQRVAGVLVDADVTHGLFARSFVVEDQDGQIIVLTVADLWSCTEVLKATVMRKLNRTRGLPRGIFTEKNVQIMGTHTHAGPAGFSSWRLYAFMTGGEDPAALEFLSDGIVASIVKAYRNKAPGKVYLNSGSVQGEAGAQRSRPAFMRNPAQYLQRFPEGINREMVLLAFWHLNKEGRPEKAIGCLNWYGLHPTDLGMDNPWISGESKGWAAQIVEDDERVAGRGDFVAGFANSSQGDVSGNVTAGRPPTGNTSTDLARLRLHGINQARAAQSLFGHRRQRHNSSVTVTGEEVSGGIDSFFAKKDMSNIIVSRRPLKRTYIGAIGLSMLAGSTEDGNPGTGLREGIREGEVTFSERAFQLAVIMGSAQITEKKGWNAVIAALAAAGIAIASGAGLFLGPVVIVAAAYPFLFDALPTLRAKPISSLSRKQVQGHGKKPIVIVTEGLAPKELPLQILKLGDVLIGGLPAEPTTVAAYKLTETLQETATKQFTKDVPKKCIISSCANAYSQYVTTEEEYDAQHYEGASTLFGPHTLAAYQKEFAALLTPGA